MKSLSVFAWNFAQARQFASREGKKFPVKADRLAFESFFAACNKLNEFKSFPLVPPRPSTNED